MRRRRRPTLHHAVKDKRVTVLGPVKQPEMDFMSHRGGGGTVTWSTQNFSLRLIVLLCGWLCCGALPLVSLALMAGQFAYFHRNAT